MGTAETHAQKQINYMGEKQQVSRTMGIGKSKTPTENRKQIWSRKKTFIDLDQHLFYLATTEVGSQHRNRCLFIQSSLRFR